MSKVAKLELEGKAYELPIVEGTEGEKAIDVSKLRATTGHITLDDGYGNTGSCESKITFIDGDKGILRYRGIPIEELALKSNFVETAYLLIYGHLPNKSELANFSELLTENETLHESMKHHFEGFPPTAHPMAILSSMINAASCYHPRLMEGYKPEVFTIQAARLISKVRTIAAFAYRKSLGLPIIYPKPIYKYTANYLHMMFSEPYKDYDLKPEVVRALDLIFVLHADHEQNCSTSTVRMIASSQANLFACAAGGVCALWGPLHGGANMAVIEMLEQIHREGDDGSRFIAAAKDKKSGKKLMGFGHRVYKNYDPRAKIIKDQCDALLKSMHISDPLLDIAKHLEEAAMHDSYFVERKLYPNVDFYSGIIMRAIGIPKEMFTVIFAIGRMPGWIANYKEIMDETTTRIYRPRQVYMGPVNQTYVPIEARPKQQPELLHMNIHEYQAKEIFRRFGIPVPDGAVASTAAEAETIARSLKADEVAVKAQIHAGGRGKAGGIKLVKTPEQVRQVSQELIGKTLVTHQTGPQGRVVHKLLITAAQTPVRELYLSILIDRGTSRPVILGSTEGGVDIEAVAEKTPEKIFKEHIDPAVGLMPYQARKIAFALNLGGDYLQQTVSLLLNLYRAFIETDASLVEINPLIINQDNKVMALDAKMNFDDNALFRHKDILAMRDIHEEDPREVEASKFNLNYIGLDGNIACMVNGAGLAMATMDIIKVSGGNPANFLDVGGGATQETVTEAFKILCSDKNVKGILVNIFGGIMKCDVIATGIIGAVKEVHLGVPLVVRLEGTNVDLGKKILSDSGLAITTADSLADAAKKIVAASK